jgi:hypothetical protein
MCSNVGAMPRRTIFAGALLTFAIAACDDAVWQHAHADDAEIAYSHALTERLRTGAIQGEDLSGDVRPEAIAILEAAAAADPRPLSLADVRGEGIAPLTDVAFEPPETIRVWRRRIDGSSASCSGRVDVIPFDQYVRGVLPHEWIPSWHEESLKAGAVAIRTYAAFHVASGGRYDCADVDDTTSTQVYKDEFLPETDAAVAATAGLYVVDENGALVLAEYSAENGDPTRFGVDEPLCSGRQVFGHGRGTCQWGSQRWATNGRSFEQILTHYYPGSSVVDVRAQLGAAEVSREVPAQLVAGEIAAASIRFENTAVDTWTTAETLLVTSPSGRTSELYDDGSWEGGDRVVAVTADTAAGQVGTFSFAVRAPLVEERTVFEESFRLSHNGQAFGPALSIELEVLPRSGGGSGGSGGGGAGGDDDQGGAADAGPAGEGGAKAPNVFGCQTSAAGGGPFALAPLCAILLLCGFVTRRRRSQPG